MVGRMSKRPQAGRLALLLAALLGVAVLLAGHATAQAKPAKGTADPVTLTVWDWGSPPPATMKALDDGYMKLHPNVTIKRVHQPFNAVFTQLRAAIAAKKGPDIFASYASPFLFDYYRGTLPLAKYVKPADKTGLDGWQYVSAGLKSTGQPYAVPWSGNGIMFYFNKALFKKAGLSTTKTPKTWSDLLNTCSKLKAAGIVPIVSGFKDGYYAEWWIESLAPQYQTDAELANVANPKWQTSAMRKAWTLLKQIHETCMTPNDEAIPLFPDAVNNFGAGKGAIFLGLDAISINWSEFAKDKVGPNLGAFMFPLAPKSLWGTTPHINYGPALAWAITKWSKNPDVAYDFLKYLTKAKAEESAFKTSGTFPNNSAAKLVTPNAVGNQVVALVNGHKHFLGQVALIRSNVQIVYDKVALEIVAGRTSIDDALKQLDDAQAKAAPIPTK